MQIRSGEPLTWQTIKQSVLAHRKSLIYAHIIALLAALVSVPIPLMMPLLVDEVLLEKPGAAIEFMNTLLPDSAHNAVGYILFVLLSVVLMRLFALVLGVLQSRLFTIIGKDISFQVRSLLLNHLPLVQL